MAINARAAAPADLDAILEFIRGLARYEKAQDQVVATVADLARPSLAPAPGSAAL